MSISDREKLVLNAIIDYYLTVGETIGSRTLVKKYGIELSSATIRNVMSDLEDMGFIEKTHTSSGRIPTDMGYKYYLDELLEIERLTYEEKRNIDNIYNIRMGEIENVLKKTTNLLSKLTNYTSIALEPRKSNDRIERVELVHIDDYMVLLIIVMDDRSVKTKKINMTYPINKKELMRKADEINRRVQKHEVDIYEIEKMIIGDEDILNEDDEDDIDKYFINNISSILKNTNSQDVYEVLEFFNEKKETKHLFEKLLQQKIDEDRHVNIIFGDELGIKELEDFSFVYSVYNIGDSKGIIGIIGPKRMQYSKTVGLIEHISNELNNAIEQFVKKHDE